MRNNLRVEGGNRWKFSFNVESRTCCSFSCCLRCACSRKFHRVSSQVYLHVNLVIKIMSSACGGKIFLIYFHPSLRETWHNIRQQSASTSEGSHPFSHISHVLFSLFSSQLERHKQTLISK